MGKKSPAAGNDGANIVMEAHDLIVGARQHDYNHPLADYRRTASIFNSIIGKEVMTPEMAVLFMLAVKLSRLMFELESGKNIPDNTRDAIGYLGCLNMIRASKAGE